MKRRYTSNDFYAINTAELSKKTAIHEAGHAAAIYLGNKQKQLPPIFFQIFIKKLKSDSQPMTCLCKAYDSCNNCVTKIDGGRLIHTLPSSFKEAVSDFSVTQEQAYQHAFEADIINLLVGPLAEANYISLRDDEPINQHLVNLHALHNYGGSSDLETINEYLDCFIADKSHKEKKLAELFLAAFHFINNRSNWRAIMALADHILADSKNIITCEEIIAVLDANTIETPKSICPQ
ncbi:hypothetical protein [Methylobacter psychrophilus]|jgi:hypothetical protein|uniref:hypothetical protein n=1 Tax=Methylobacter psychrophilus TaxID=96941 RepID=UPI0021D4BD77|nr:hypothetical protein [Methylobacter psychrophilus]